MAVVQIGLLGKHPGYGDFLRYGMEEDLADKLMAWIDPTLHSVREHTGDGWESFWDNAQDLRFWIGRTVFGRSLAGVLRPSRDKVGRRYPLILLAEEPMIDPPMSDPDQKLYDALSAHLDAMTPGQGAKALMEDLSEEGLPEAGPDEETAAAEGPTIWAHHPEGDMDALLRSAMPVDHIRAATTRSYWWSTGGNGRAAVWAGLPGMPPPQTMAWLLAGIAGQVAAPEEIEEQDEADEMSEPHEQEQEPEETPATDV